jgi:hypothetical protein
MGMAAGVALAFMKIIPIAFAIMGIVWVAAKISVALHRKKHGHTGADDADDAE